jgi:hypothetical protein
MSKKIPKEDPFKLVGVTEDELKKSATIYNETTAALKKLRRKNEAMLAARANEAIANKKDVSQAVEEELSNLVDEERKLHKELSTAAMSYRQLLDKLKYRYMPVQRPFPLHPQFPRPVLQYLCPPRSVQPLHLLSFCEPIVFCSNASVTAPTENEIEASENPPEIHIFFAGEDYEGSCFAFGDIKWGIDIQDDQICKLEIGGRSLIGSSIAYFPVIDGPTNYDVVLEGNITIVQYRGHCTSVTELDTFTTPCYNIWKAHPPSSFESGNPDQTVTEPESPGFVDVKPHSSEIFEEIRDVKPGDSFVFYYFWSVSVHSGLVLCNGENDAAHLVFYPPHAVQYVFREPTRLIKPHRPWM